MDSKDVVLNVPDHHRAQGKKNKLKTLVLAYRTLGIVFGSLVTSPLYVYPSMPLQYPTEEDYLGIFSIMFWTITLIGLIKYANIAIKADDHGEGGTSAVYSLLLRHLNTRERHTWLENLFANSLVAKRLLLFITILGTCMVIGDGVLTPAISVLSAMEGLRAPFPSVTKSHVEALSVIVLVFMFLLQRFGTSRVSFLFSPIMGAWILCTPIVGIYSIIHYYPAIFKAFSPHYIFHFFWKNGKYGWLLLGGTVLCITGTEAMFADLGHFSPRSIQIAFIFTIYPSLVLTYAGQTAYLIKNPNDHNDGFYKFIPPAMYWPMFVISTLAAVVASQSLISATFSVIKQSVVLEYFPRVRIVHTSNKKEGEVYSPEVNYFLMILCVAVILIFGDGQAIGNSYGVVVSLVMVITTVLLTLVMLMIWRTPIMLVSIYFSVFFVIEGTYVSAVFVKFPEGGWIPFAISVILAFIMFSWFYSRQRKLEYEMTNRIAFERLGDILADNNVERVPGLCFFYSNIEDALPPIFGHYMKTIKSIHKVTIFITLKYLLVPKVDPHERILIKKTNLKGVYGCVIKYGYADDIEGDNFEDQVINNLKLHIQNCYIDSQVAQDEEVSGGLEVAQGVAQVAEEEICLEEAPFVGVAQEAEEEVSNLEEAQLVGIVHLRGKTKFYIGNCGWFDKIVLGFYEVMRGNCRSGMPDVGLSLKQGIEVGMFYQA